jgi:hypothetical protein
VRIKLFPMLAGYLICNVFNGSWIGNISGAAGIVGEVLHTAPSQMRPRSIHLTCGSNWLTTHLAVVVCKLPSPNGSSVFSTRSLSDMRVSKVPGMLDLPRAKA